MARNDVGEATRITNALLDLLESFPMESLVIATTNLDSTLDSALFRRFDELLRLGHPGTDEIRRLFVYTLSPMKVEKRLPLEGIVL
jgi:SpoVK/Ycf46/Vps4 family AAA+-type ATPase